MTLLRIGLFFSGVMFVYVGFDMIRDPEYDFLDTLIALIMGALMMIPALLSIFPKRKNASSRKPVTPTNPAVTPTNPAVAPTNPAVAITTPSRESVPESNPEPPQLSNPQAPEYVADYTVIDTETTGLSSVDRIVQFSALRVRDHKVVDALTLLINPQIEIPKRISDIHGITNAKVSGCPAFSDVASQITDFIGGDVVVGHNIPFDLRMLNGDLRRCELPAVDNPYLDTLAMARLTLQTRKRTLSSVCETLGIAAESFHDAASDCTATQQCYEKMLPFSKVYSGSAFEVNSSDWTEWNQIAKDKSQKDRMARAASCKPVHVSPDNSRIVFEGSNGEEYDVTINSCTCPDFQDRKKPCKHMYRFVAETNAFK